MKLAGRKSTANAARKIPQVHAAMRAQEAGQSFKVFSDDEIRDMNRVAMAVRDETPEDFNAHSEWFVAPDETPVASDSEVASLDAMIEAHGLLNVLETLARLMDSRVDAMLLQNGRVIYHLAKEDDYAHAAHRIRSLIHDERLRKL